MKIKKLTPVQKLTISGVTMALYIVVMLATQSFAFREFQIRIATALYALAAPFPFLIIPLALSNLLSNILMGSLGPLDAIGGFAAGLITTLAAYYIRKKQWNDWLLAVPVTFGPGLLVPIWLSVLLSLPYSMLAFSLCIGQIVPGIVGVLLVKGLERTKYFRSE